MNSYTTVEAPVCGNWNSYSPSIMSSVGLQSNTQKQFWDWETNTSTSSSHPFIIPTTSFIDFSSTSAPTSLPPNYPQMTHYSSMTNGFLKREDGFFGVDGGSHGNTRIGLNLGHRTYFSSRETQVINRLFKRSRGFYQANQIPRCQVEGCKVDLTNSKHYHRRHRVCEIHSKAGKVVLAGGIEQRFCQQCSRFHSLAEFDEEKRSCRKRLADHNRRRRKPRPGTISLDLGAGKTALTAIEKFQEAEKMTRGSSFPLLTTKDYKSSNQEKMKHFEQKVVVSQLQKAPALSLDGSRIVQRSSESQVTYNHLPFFSPSYFARESISSSSCAINCHCCNINLLREASHSNSGRSDQTHQQQPEELHNLLQLGHAMFEVGLL